MIKQGQTIFLLNNYFSRRENLTWKTFLVELSRSRAKGAQLVTNLVTFAWAPFHLIKINVWFKILATSMQYRMEQYFRNIYPNFRKLSSGSFLSAFNFAPECKNKISGWMVRISDKSVSGSLGTFPGKYCTNCRCFRSLLSFGFLESAQNASKKFWFSENRPHVLRCAKKCAARAN